MPSPLTLTVSGNEITDLNRGVQGDGLYPLPTSAFGIYEASTNKLVYSSDLTNAAWAKYQCTVISGGDDPYGGTSSFNIQTTGTVANLSQTVTGLVASTAYYIQFWARFGTINAASYQVYDATNSATITGSVSYFGLLNSATFTRVVVPFTTPAGCTSVIFYILNAAVVNTGGTLYIWRPQLEQKAYPTAWIPTSAVAVTRAAAAVSMPGSVLDVGTGVIAGCVEMAMDWGVQPQSYVFDAQKDATHRIGLYVSTNHWTLTALDGTTTQALTKTVGFSAGTLVYYIAYWTPSGLGLFVGIAAAGVYTTASRPLLWTDYISTLNIGTLSGTSLWSNCAHRWLVTGLGTPTAADITSACTFSSGTDPSISSFSAAFHPTRTWTADTAVANAVLINPSTAQGVDGTWNFFGINFNDGASFFVQSHTLRTLPNTQEILVQPGRADSAISLGGYLAERKFDIVLDAQGTSSADAESKWRTLITNISPRKGYGNLYASFLSDSYIIAKLVGAEGVLSTEFINQVRGTLHFEAADGVRYGLASVASTPALAFAVVTGSHYSASFTVAPQGSDLARPVWTLTLTGAAYTISSLWLTNTTTGQTATVQAALAPGDVIAFDTINQRVLVNGVVTTAPLYGTFPQLDPTVDGGVNSIAWHAVTSGAFAATQSIAYTPRYLD